MSSYNIYPPTLSPTAKAFIGVKGCDIYYSLSRLSSASNKIVGMQLSIIDQSTGRTVANPALINESAQKIATTGIIILNTVGEEVGKNLYHINVPSEYINNGWVAGKIYKIQIRFSEELFDGSDNADWLVNKANKFSEWSTYCVTKCIGIEKGPIISIPLIDEFEVKLGTNITKQEKFLKLSTLELVGSYTNLEDPSEKLSSYEFTILETVEENSDKVADAASSGVVNYDARQGNFVYVFPIELKSNSEYTVTFTYTTNNNYTDTKTYKFSASYDLYNLEHIIVCSVDNYPEYFENEVKEEGYNHKPSLITTKFKEEEEGRICLRLYSDNGRTYNGNLCVRRASSKDNFKTWTDIKKIVCKTDPINDLPVFYDYTVESGVWYLYGVEAIEIKAPEAGGMFSDENGVCYNRSVLVKMPNPIIREFQYSFLLGKNNQQLKLKYNNTMNSYNYTMSENKADPIGGKYPVISRNGILRYRSIPVNGLISFNMDENNLFTSDEKIYQYDQVVDLYNNRRDKLQLGMYDYTKERDFREEVIAFLQNGEPKLFKSPTEGNIILQLMNVATAPNQTTNRLIGSFTSTGYEIADATDANYLKYEFYNPGEYANDFTIYDTALGQLRIDAPVGTDILAAIVDKYEIANRNKQVSSRMINKIYSLRITFEGEPLRIETNDGFKVLGNSFLYNGKQVVVPGMGTRIYDFGTSFDLYPKADQIIIQGSTFEEDAEHHKTIPIIVDFVYDYGYLIYSREIKDKTTTRGVGQIHGRFSPGTSLYSIINNRYAYNQDTLEKILEYIYWVRVESNSDAVFLIKDTADPPDGEYSQMNATELFALDGNDIGMTDFIYAGRRAPDGSIITENADMDILIDYCYSILNIVYTEAIQ